MATDPIANKAPAESEHSNEVSASKSKESSNQDRSDSRPKSDPNEAIATVDGPQSTALENAPTGWDKTGVGSPASMGTPGHDPARPQGLTRDVEGLDPSPPQDHT